VNAGTSHTNDKKVVGVFVRFVIIMMLTLRNGQLCLHSLWYLQECYGGISLSWQASYTTRGSVKEDVDPALRPLSGGGSCSGHPNCRSRELFAFTISRIYFSICLFYLVERFVPI
jgi:hypothetical protein